MINPDELYEVPNPVKEGAFEVSNRLPSSDRVYFRIESHDKGSRRAHVPLNNIRKKYFVVGANPLLCVVAAMGMSVFCQFVLEEKTLDFNDGTWEDLFILSSSVTGKTLKPVQIRQGYSTTYKKLGVPLKACTGAPRRMCMRKFHMASKHGIVNYNFAEASLIHHAIGGESGSGRRIASVATDHYLDNHCLQVSLIAGGWKGGMKFGAAPHLTTELPADYNSGVLLPWLKTEKVEADRLYREDKCLKGKTYGGMLEAIDRCLTTFLRAAPFIEEVAGLELQRGIFSHEFFRSEAYHTWKSFMLPEPLPDCLRSAASLEAERSAQFDMSLFDGYDSDFDSAIAAILNMRE